MQQRRHRPPALGQSRGARQLLQVPLQCSSCGKSLLQQAVRLCSRDRLRPARRACPSPAWAGRPYVLVRSGCSRWRLELQSLDWPVPQWRGRQSGTRPAGCFYRRPLQQAWLGPFGPCSTPILFGWWFVTASAPCHGPGRRDQWTQNVLLKIYCSSNCNPIELLHFRDFCCFSMQCDQTGNHSEDDRVD